jgi:hypothetical protein
MAREPDLDRLTTLLGQCLGRIDERAYRVQQDDEDADAEHVLEHEAATLQELVGSLAARVDAPEQCDLARIVRSAVDACLTELGGGLVVRQRLAADLPPIGCMPSQLAYAVQRALVITAGRLERGGELLVTARRDGRSAVLELESRGGRRDRHLPERTLTLCEFVASLGGHCRVDHGDRGDLFVVLELPEALALDES